MDNLLCSFANFLMSLARSLNEIRSNVWSVMLIILGISLVLHGHESVGSSLVTGAFAVFRSSDSKLLERTVTDAQTGSAEGKK